LTLKALPELPSLRDVRFVREFERSLRDACERGRFRVAHYTIQPDHVHLIVEASSREDLAAGMKSIGARFARAVNRTFRLRGPVLADRYHLHILRTPREVRNAIAYVLLNARRHLAKRRGAFEASPRVDPASSGRWFDGWRSPSASCTGSDVPAVAPARTWLLRVGWRRRGLIDPSEVPGMAGRRLLLRGPREPTGVARAQIGAPPHWGEPSVHAWTVPG
jgi:REP element-mobilizing transposase RayT